MRHALPSLSALLLIVTGGTALAVDHPELKAFPAAEEGMQRFVIVLADKDRDEEQAFKVEITVGKEMLTDGVNSVFLGNTIEEHVVKGWGYNYFKVTGPGTVGSTLIAPPPGTPQVKRLVTAPPKLIPYNSRLPIVVYAPKGYVVQYRIWEREKSAHEAEKG